MKVKLYIATRLYTSKLLTTTFTKYTRLNRARFKNSNIIYQIHVYFFDSSFIVVNNMLKIEHILKSDTSLYS